MIKVSSSHITGIDYDKNTRTLKVTFKNGSEYHYPNHSEQQYKALLKANSVGEHFHNHIHGKPYKKVK